MNDLDAARAALAGFTDDCGRPANDVARDLVVFVELLRKWQAAQNLVSRETLESVWTRHVRDSLQLLTYLAGQEHTVLDIGSGGGFPALPLAIAVKNRPICFHLVESNRRKCAFLRAVARTLDLDVSAHATRVEALEPGDLPPVDIVTSRATAPLSRLFWLAAPFVRPETRMLLHKGREYGEELREADADWHMNVVVYTSITDEAAAVLDLSGLDARS